MSLESWMQKAQNSQPSFFFNIKAISNVSRMFLSGQEHQKVQLDVINGKSETTPSWWWHSTRGAARVKEEWGGGLLRDRHTLSLKQPLWREGDLPFLFAPLFKLFLFFQPRWLAPTNKKIALPRAAQQTERTGLFTGALFVVVTLKKRPFYTGLYTTQIKLNEDSVASSYLSLKRANYSWIPPPAFFARNES